MWAFNTIEKTAFLVIKYSLKVLERGTDTDFGKEELWIYNPMSRAKILIDNPKNWVIYNSYKDVKPLIVKQDEQD